MSLSIGGRTEIVSPDGITYLQSGTVHVGPGHEETVYYPVPFQSPPNLALEEPWHDWQIVEQRPDCFRIKSLSSFSRDVRWTARGLRVVPAPVPPPFPPPQVTEQTAAPAGN
jgi:hypothetical protein